MSYKPLSVECPYCKAKVDKACMQTTGKARKPHRGRIRLAKRKVAQEDFNQIAAWIRRATESKKALSPESLSIRTDPAIMKSAHISREPKAKAGSNRD